MNMNFNQSYANMVFFIFQQNACNILQHLYNNKVEQQNLVKQEEGVEQEVKQEEGVQLSGQMEDESLNQLKQEKKYQIANENQNDYNKIHIFPGQSKNYYKNMGQKIVRFIFEHFQDDQNVMGDTYIKQFIKITSQGFNRNAILKLKKSRIARKILKLFFANYKWVKPFISQHKAELDLYFRYNTQVYSSKKKQLQSQKLKNDQLKQKE
ncbi:unnamed protein product [Paramecium pentaurelia]|uniref:Uncharacterized protein n=1 Tax=Paramecium pentaurelia TaxID=43138 RepID=A0A8S1T9B5_9CILI|nr:unnamed protein product [Paramecium pentaurelia]